jgi:c-di-GMP-binding flagellar brake protein YcgR
MTPPEAPATQAAALSPDALPLGQPLAWPVVDHDGTLLLERGSILVGEPERQFLFTHFQPQRGDSEAPLPATAEAGEPSSATPPGTRDMHLALGALMGLRTQTGGSGAPVNPCRLIGVAPNEMLFVTPPIVAGRKVSLLQGEHVEVIAIASQAVYRFVSSVEAICQSPFDYVVLSKPAAIRRLRERKSIRVRAHVPVRYRLANTGNGYDGIALARGISALGLSISAPWALGKVGERLHIAFELRSDEIDTAIATTAIIRNVQHEAGPESPATLGLELDQLTAAERMAMKSYIFDRQDDVMYWADSVR